jgi:hypothetical protein
MGKKRPKMPKSGFFLSDAEYKQMLDEMSRDYERFIAEHGWADLDELTEMFNADLSDCELPDFNKE